eukprot:scaffold7641_cov107-Isochrysis_galbana.AAC.2
MTPEQLGSATPEIYRSLMLHVANILRAEETEEEEEEGEEEEEFVEPGEALVRFEPLNPPATPSAVETTGRSRPRGQPTPEEIRLARPTRDKKNIARPRTRSAFREMGRDELVQMYNRYHRERYGVTPTVDDDTTAEDLAEEIITMY